MPISLRAFLLTRTPFAEWDVEVFHSLEDVLRAWSKCDALTTAVLHVGFERRTARSFEDLASRFPGRVLLTPGGKGALPHSFQNSQNAIGHVDGEAIYLALEGWGYAEQEPLRSMPSSETRLTGWVKTFSLAFPADLSALAEAGIGDEDSYIEHENNLQIELRARLGAYRSAHLVGGDTSDPTALARAAPPWLSETNLDQLNLTVRIRNVFRGKSIIRVADLAKLNMYEMLKFPNFGRTSTNHLVTILRDALDAGPPRVEEEILVGTTATLLEAVHLSLITCTDRERDILVRRMGLGRSPETLNEIGETYGVTRERIRQIEAKVVTRLVRQEIWDDLLASKLHAMLTDREFPLPLIGAEALDPWFAGVGAHRNAVGYLIANMCNAAVSLVEIDGIEYLSFLSQDSWSEIVGAARRLLESGVDRAWTKQDAKHHVTLLVPDNAREFSALLWNISSKWCHFAHNGETQTLIAYGRSVDQIVETVLLESDVPLHYTEIALQAAARAGRFVEERRVHNAAAEVAYLFGSGTYGMQRHLAVRRAEWELIADEASEIIAEAPPERQWHTSELIELLRERGIGFPSVFDKYQLDIVLKLSDQLNSFGRMVWSRREFSGEGSRLDIRQAVFAILQAAGAPITSDELRQRLVAVRGINHGMQIQALDPVIKLDSHLWGLNDRDLQIKRPDQKLFLNAIVDKLREIMKPVHISDCEKVFGGVIPARALFCLASSDTRLRSSRSRFLTLSEWQSASLADEAGAGEAA